MQTLVFEQAYFMDNNGLLSNYENYLNRNYSALCSTLISECAICRTDRIVDYGCATGLLVKAFKDLGFADVVGTDISYWAIEWGKLNLDLESELQYYNRNLLAEGMDWLILLDVLEHFPTEEEIDLTLRLVSKSPPRKGVVVRLPVVLREGEDFPLEKSRIDKTHVHKHTSYWWLSKFSAFGLEAKKFFSNNGVIWNSSGVLTVLLERHSQ